MVVLKGRADVAYGRPEASRLRAGGFSSDARPVRKDKDFKKNHFTEMPRNRLGWKKSIFQLNGIFFRQH